VNDPPSQEPPTTGHGLESAPVIVAAASTSAQRKAQAADTRLPLVTIFTPTYDRAHFLPETIESILSQDYSNLEYIVLDNGSSDDTQAILRRYGDAVRWEHHPDNIGLSRAINRGFELARGDIIGFVSDDDPLLPGAISALVEVFQSDPDVLVVYPDWDVIDGEGRHVRHIDTYEYAYVDMVRYHHTYPGPGALFRRSVLDRIGGLDESYRIVSDYDFWLRAGLLGPFRRCPRTLARYRQHSTAATHVERGVGLAREHIRVIDKLYERTDLPPEVLAVKTEAYRNAHYVAAMILRLDMPADERFALTDCFFTPRSDASRLRRSMQVLALNWRNVVYRWRSRR
jgi:glycosyltransferase involved in cell wall biosynthesis